MSTTYSDRFYAHRLICEQCGEPFSASRYDAKYCSATCRSRAYRELRRAGKLRAQIDNLVIDLLNLYTDNPAVYQAEIDRLIVRVSRHSLIPSDHDGGVQ